MSVMLRRLVPLTVAALALMLPGTALAKGGGSSAANQIRASVDRTAASLKQATLTGAVTVQASAKKKVSISLGGQLDLVSHNGIVHVGLGAAVGQPVSIEERIVDGIVYVNFGSLFSALGQSPPAELAGKPWVRIDPKALIGHPGAAGQLGATGGTDPTGQLAALRGIQNAQKVGTDVIDGTSTMQYRGTVDIKAAIANAPQALQQQVAASLASIPGGKVPVEVWLDAGGAVRKFSVAFTPTVSGKKTPVQVSFQLGDLNGAVNVTAPPPDQVVDYQTYLNAVGASAGT